MDDRSPSQRAFLPIPDCWIPDKAKEHLRKLKECLAEAEKDGVFGVCYVGMYEGEGMVTAGTATDVPPDSAITLDLWRSVLIKELQFAVQNFDPVRLKAELAVCMDAAKESLK